MLISYLSEIFNRISKFIGLPPLVFICAVGLSVFLFALALLVIHKLRSINKELKELNRSLNIFSQHLKYPAASLKGKKIEKDGISENWKSSPDIRRKIIDQLRKTGRPISYHDITRQLSLIYPDYDYDSALKELDQLEKEGEIEGHLGAGKLYFKINHKKNL